MKTWLKVLSGVLLGAALLVLVLPASRAEAEEITGTGQLWAGGVGEAIVDGDGLVVIHLRGEGVVWVTGAERLAAWGRGRRVDLPDGTVRFEGWRGTVRASGEGLHVRMLGGYITFYAEGSGTVFLKGRGWYRVNGTAGQWSRHGITISLD